MHLLKRAVFIFFIGFAASLLFLTILGFFSESVPLADIFVNLRLFYFQAGLALLILGGLARSKTLVWLNVVGVLLNGYEMLPYLIPTEGAPDYDLTIVAYNTDRYRYPKVGAGEIVDFLEEVEPDVAVLVDVGTDPAAELTAHFESTYPYVAAFQHEPMDGAMVLSRYPLRNSQFESLGGGRPVILTDLEIKGQLIHIITPHFTNPFNDLTERNNQFVAVAEHVTEIGRPAIVAGDLNATMWTAWYGRLTDAGLSSVRLGNGVMPTWRVTIQERVRMRFIYLPLDHILVSETIQVHSAEVLPSPGSDHQPILARLKIVNE